MEKGETMNPPGHGEHPSPQFPGVLDPMPRAVGKDAESVRPPP
jgi:hypothetical protein